MAAWLARFPLPFHVVYYIINFQTWGHLHQHYYHHVRWRRSTDGRRTIKVGNGSGEASKHGVLPSAFFVFWFAELNALLINHPLQLQYYYYSKKQQDVSFRKKGIATRSHPYPPPP
eukprot:scaffold2330_cov153-Amphora_coffeaeformis.AAC.3